MLGSGYEACEASAMNLSQLARTSNASNFHS
jgi:hypothetical protein